jgi:DNA-binding PadR family transcriptional regulator
MSHKINNMSLAHAILVCLADEPMTGYELAKRFDSSVGFFWRANHQQIYRELSSLSEKNWVLGRTVAQASRPNKTIFSITSLGRDELLTWSRQDSESAALKEELMLKFYALDQVDLPAVLQQVRDRAVTHRARLALYEKIFERNYRDPAKLDVAAHGRLLGLRAGMRFERTWIEWCAEAVESLESLAALAAKPARKARRSPS